MDYPQSPAKLAWVLRGTKLLCQYGRANCNAQYLAGVNSDNPALYLIIYRCKSNISTIFPSLFDVLVYLIRHRDRMVTKQELCAHLWPGQFVTDVALARCLVAAHKAIGNRDNARQPIRTVYGRG
jgi:hypothetical protein